MPPVVEEKLNTVSTMLVVVSVHTPETTESFTRNTLPVPAVPLDRAVIVPSATASWPLGPVARKNVPDSF